MKPSLAMFKEVRECVEALFLNNTLEPFIGEQAKLEVLGLDVLDDARAGL
jgi:hypothetical protein